MSRTTLFYVLLGAGFIGVALLWAPQLFGSVTTLSGSATKEAFESTDRISQEWKRTQDVFDRLSVMLQTEVKDPFSYMKNSLEGAARASSIIASSTPNTCAEKKGSSVVRKGPGSLEYTVCVFPDATECERELLESGRCSAGQYARAEQALEKKPDLQIRVERSGYCTGGATSVEWMDEKDAPSYCLENVVVKNCGWVPSGGSKLYINTMISAIPPLSSGEEARIVSYVPVTRTANSETHIKIIVDSNKEIIESNEENNTITLP